MAEQYFDRNDRAAWKPKLDQYLRDKGRRRGKITSDEFYEGASGEFMKDRAYQDFGGLMGALSNSASMAGTLGGKRSDASIIPNFMASQKDAAQTHYGNEMDLRGLEENALRMDLNIAQGIAGIDAADSNRKLEDRRVNLAENQAANQRTLAQQALDRDIADKYAARTHQTNVLGETSRHNRAMEGLYGKGRGPGADRPNAWQMHDAVDANGNPAVYQVDPMTGKARAVELPTGLQPAKKAGAADKPLTVEERSSSMFWNNAENALKVLEEMEAKGYRPTSMSIFKGRAPDEFRGHIMSSDEARYQQAAEDYTAAKLRLESGASIPPAELTQQARIYMATPGEKDDALAQKAISRRKALQGLEFKAGRGAEQIKNMPGQNPNEKTVEGVRYRRVDGGWKKVP